MNNFNFANTPGGKLVAELRQQTRDMFVVPNSCLPVEFHDNVRGGRTLQRLNEMTEQRDGVTAHVKLKAIKARNIERLAAQVAADATDIDAPLDYSHNERDEIQQHKNEMALVSGMVSGGLIDADELEME